MKFFSAAILLIFLLAVCAKKFCKYKKIIAVICIIVSVISILEIFARLMEQYIPINYLWVSDKKLGFRLRADYNGSNKFGFNDKDYSFDKKKGILRIAALGDSFNWAGGYTGNYLNISEEILNKDPGNIEIINAGFPAVGPGYLFDLYNETILKFQHEMVSLNFFVGNDFTECVSDTGITLRFGNPYKPSNKHFFKITEESYLFYYLDNYRKILKDIILKKIEKGNAGKNKDEEKVFSLSTFLKIEKDRIKIYMPDFYNSEHWINTKKKILEFKNLTAAQNKYFFVAILPAQIQSDKKLLNELEKEYNDIDKQKIDLTLPQRKLREFLKQNNIDFLDPLDSFIKSGASKELYAKNDTHFNSEGNLLYAAEYAGFVRKMYDIVIRKQM